MNHCPWVNVKPYSLFVILPVTILIVVVALSSLGWCQTPSVSPADSLKREEAKHAMDKRFNQIRITATEQVVDASTRLSPQTKDSLSKKLSKEKYAQVLHDALTPVEETLTFYNVTSNPLKEVVLRMDNLGDVKRVSYATGKQSVFETLPFRFDSLASSVVCSLKFPLLPKEVAQLKLEYLSEADAYDYNSLWVSTPTHIQNQYWIKVKLIITTKPEEVAIGVGKLINESKDEKTGKTTYVWEANHCRSSGAEVGPYISYQTKAPDRTDFILYIQKPEGNQEKAFLDRTAPEYLKKAVMVYQILTQHWGSLNTSEDTLTYGKIAIIGVPRPSCSAATSVMFLNEKSLWWELKMMDKYRSSPSPPDYLSRAPEAHEIGHNWWGISVKSYRQGEDTLTNGDRWLTEGLVEDAVNMVQQEMAGQEVFLRSLRGGMKYYTTPPSPKDQFTQKVLPPRDPMKVRSIFDERMAWNDITVPYMLRTLRYILGVDNYDRTLRALFQRFRYGHVSEKEFSEAFQRENPKINLDWFFPLFFKNGDYARIDYGLEDVKVDTLKGGKYRVGFSVEDKSIVYHTRSTPVLPIGVEVLVKTSDPAKDIMLKDIRLDKNGRKRVACETSALPDSVLLDPDLWLIGVDWNVGNQKWVFKKD